MTPRKRSIEELGLLDGSPEHNIKPKTHEAAQAAAESNSESSYVSAAAAIFSDSDEEGQDTAPSEVDPDTDLSISSDEPSSESSDSEEDSSEDKETSVDPIYNGSSVADDARVNVRPGSKPSIMKEKRDDSLLRRLKAFLPDMEAANQELEKERAAGTLGNRIMEQTEEGGAHIEMNLGLGVLKDKTEDDSDSSSDDEDEIMSDENGEPIGGRSVLQRLMGESDTSSERKGNIQVLGEG